MGKPLALTGRRFGSLTAIEVVGRDRHRQNLWRCICDCGGTKVTAASYLTNGETVRCRDCPILSDAPEYIAYHNMLQRTQKVENPGFKDYGARGIVVDPTWLGPDGFQKFLTDLGLRPSSLHSLERVNNDLGYSPSNCVWATQKTQMRNTRRTKRVNFRGEVRALRDVIDDHSIVSFEKVRGRLRLGWTLEDALFTPSNSWNPKRKAA